MDETGTETTAKADGCKQGEISLQPTASLFGFGRKPRTFCGYLVRGAEREARLDQYPVARSAEFAP